MTKRMAIRIHQNTAAWRLSLAAILASKDSSSSCIPIPPLVDRLFNFWSGVSPADQLIRLMFRHVLGLHDLLHEEAGSRSAKVAGFGSEGELNIGKTPPCCERAHEAGSKAGVISRLAVNGELHPQLQNRPSGTAPSMPQGGLLPGRASGGGWTFDLFATATATTRRGLRPRQI